MTDTTPQPNPLHRRMIEDMIVRNLSPATQRSYLHSVTEFSRCFGRSSDRLALEDVRAVLEDAHRIDDGRQEDRRPQAPRRGRHRRSSAVGQPDPGGHL